MDANFKRQVLEKWNKYFLTTSLPIGVFYSDDLHGAEYVRKPAPNSRGYTCIFAQMARLHQGQSLAFDASVLCRLFSAVSIRKRLPCGYCAKSNISRSTGSRPMPCTGLIRKHSRRDDTSFSNRSTNLRKRMPLSFISYSPSQT